MAFDLSLKFRGRPADAFGVSLPRRLGVVVAFATALTAASVPSAQAGPLVASAPSCEEQVLKRAYLPFLDPAHYVLAPDGGFEDGAAGWSLRSAKVVQGNEPYFLRAAGDARSLRLPGGAQVTSPTMCVGLEHPTVRIMARNLGSVLQPLAVAVNFVDATGAVQTLPIGAVVGGSSWAPSLPLPVVANLLPLLPGEMTPVSFTFTTAKGSAGWQIDDVYVDPYSRN